MIACKKCLTLSVLMFVLVFAVGAVGVLAEAVSNPGEACFVVLRGEAKRHYDVSFPVNYSEFNNVVVPYRSGQNMVSTVSDTPQFRHYVYDFGRQTSWIPISPYFADKRRPVKEFAITFYYNNGVFEGCGFTMVSALGSYALSTISTGRLGDNYRYGDLTSRDVSKDGFVFNLAKYSFDFKDGAGSEMARYDTISLASSLTPVYREQFLANKLLSHVTLLQLKGENDGLKAEVSELPAKEQRRVLVWNVAYLVIIAVLLVLLVRASLKLKNVRKLN